MADVKIGVGITLYNPENREIGYIANCLKGFSTIYVYDNSENNSKTLTENATIVYWFNGKNDGLAVAFNSFLKKAYEDDIDYLLILDQDSLYNDEEIQRLKTEIACIPYDKSVGIYACKAQPANVEQVFLPEEPINEEEMVISSGSFLNLKAIQEKKIAYDNNLFVDYVDTDFCRQLRNNSLKIICYNRYVMKQSLGYLYKNRICHSAIRHYYMVRDLGYLNIKYNSKFVTVLKTIKFYFTNLITILHEDDKKKKIMYSSKGLRDYFTNVKGECPIKKG